MPVEVQGQARGVRGHAPRPKDQRPDGVPQHGPQGREPGARDQVEERRHWRLDVPRIRHVPLRQM